MTLRAVLVSAKRTYAHQGASLLPLSKARATRNVANDDVHRLLQRLHFQQDASRAASGGAVQRVGQVQDRLAAAKSKCNPRQAT